MKNIKQDMLTEQIFKAIEEIKNSHCMGTYYWSIGEDDKNNNWAIVLGWSNGFEEEPDDDFSKETWRLCLKLAYQPSNSLLQCDYDIDWLLPCNPKTGDIYEAEYPMYPNSNSALYVHDLLRDAIEFKIINKKEIC